MKRIILVFLLVFLLFGCSPSNTSAPTSTVPINTPIPISTNTIAPLPTYSLEDIECEDVKSSNLDELNSKGTIIFHDKYYDAYMMNLKTFTKVKLNADDEVVFSIEVSPDQQLAAYQLGSRNTLKSNLIIIDISGVTQITIPWEEGWSFIASWLDNQRLLINAYGELSDGQPGLAAKEFSTFLVLNPFTGERKLLEPDFPNIYSHHMFPAWSGFGSTAYSPTLDRVVYLLANGPDSDFHYVLWDMDEERSLADFAIIDVPNAIPRWSPNGQEFAITLDLIEDDNTIKWPVYNLYTVSRDGDLKKIADLSKYYLWYSIGEYSWSPDGRYIAFWFSGWVEQPQSFFLIANQYFAIVDTKDKDISIYCIYGKPEGMGRVPAPVWSPDGSQILVESPLPDDHSQVLLLDLNRKVIVEIGKDMTPIGWMVEP